MAAIITASDLPTSIRSHELVQTWVGGANAKAARVAPCLVAVDPLPTDEQLAEARLILVGAVERWAEAGSGAVSSRTEQAGPYGTTTTIDTRPRTGYNLWPSEIQQLQELCRAAGKSGAFAVDTAPSGGSMHLPWCSLNFGANYCSCGVDLTGDRPLYEGADPWA